MPARTRPRSARARCSSRSASRCAPTAAGAPEVPSPRAEKALAGQTPSEDLFARAAALAAEDCSPTADQRGPVDYKRHLARELTHRALRRAAARALSQEA